MIFNTPVYIMMSSSGAHPAAMLAPLWLLSRTFEQGKSTGWFLKGITVVTIAGVFVSSIIIDTAYLKGFR